MTANLGIGTWAAWLLIGSSTLFGQTLERAELIRKQADQERARVLTRSLLDGVLELQLRQLEDNGLTELPVYRDIGLMRTHLQEIVDQEMPRVVELLAASYTAPPDQRDASFVAAREMIRTVVVRLSAERHSLLRRLKAAELTEQVLRLIELQTNVQVEVSQLREVDELRRVETLLQTREDQRDVREFFLHLVDTLDDVRTWGGSISQTAVDGLRLLQVADLGRHLDQAEVELQTPDLPTAIEHQTAVLKGLTDLLRMLQQSQGGVDAERRETLQKLRAIAERQTVLRNEARQLASETSAEPEVINEQIALRQAIEDLQGELQDTPASKQLLQQAAEAAKAASEELFQARNTAAVSRQGDVLTNLAALEDLLTRDQPTAASDRTAAELAKEVQSLTEAQQKLEEISARQADAVTAAKTETAPVSEQERSIAKELETLAEADDLPKQAAEAIRNAEIATEQAADALAQSKGAADEGEIAHLEDASDALDRALASVARELEETQRRADAVLIGELARAAEVLERAAAEERDIAAQIKTARNESASMSPESIEQLATRQADVAKIAEKVAQGLEETVPEVGAAVAKSQGQAQAVAEALQSAKDLPEEKQSAQLAQAQQSSQSTAADLSRAAADLRREIAKSAQGLAERSEAVAEELSSARAEVEAAASLTPASLGERMAALQQARELTRNASAEQQRASGRPNAAAAMELAREIEAAGKAQLAADQSAKQWQQGAAPTPLRAMSAQQEVAEMSAALAEQVASMREQGAPNPDTQEALKAIEDSLEAARSAASEAARQTLDNQPTQAAAARDKARQALEQAAAQARTASEQSREMAPTGKPDPAAQQVAAANAARAAAMAAPESPDAATELSKASELAQQAAEELTSSPEGNARPIQQQVEEQLVTAERELDAAIKSLAEMQAAALAEQAQRAADLLPSTSRLDNGAEAALEAAQDAALSASSPQATPSAVNQAVASAQEQLERATASLATREQEVRRDQAVAAALAELANRQQQAAEELAEQRQALSEATPAEGMTPENAGASAEAARQFAEAQTATGQGAVELSGQEQVANTPLREALEQASQLLSAQMAQQMASSASGSPPTTPTTPSVPAEGTSPAPNLDPSAAAAAPQEGTPPGEGTTPAPASSEMAAGDAQPGAPTPDTGFVPNSPELTAQLLAGPQLAQAMQQAAAAQSPNATSSSNPADPNAQPLETNSLAQNSATPNQSESSSLQTARNSTGQMANGDIKDGSLQDQPEGTDLGETSGSSRNGDAELGRRQFQDEPWFAKLPPELRKSIGSGTRQRMPKAYEDRLRRYFESIDK